MVFASALKRVVCSGLVAVPAVPTAGVVAPTAIPPSRASRGSPHSRSRRRRNRVRRRHKPFSQRPPCSAVERRLGG